MRNFYHNYTLTGVMDDAYGLLEEAMSDPSRFASATSEARQIIDQEFLPAEKEFRAAYEASPALIIAIRKINRDYGESLMNKLNSFSARYKQLIDAVFSSDYVEDVRNYVNQFLKLTNDMKSFYNELLNISSMSPVEIEKMQPAGFFDKLTGMAKFAMISGLVYAGIKVLPQLKKGA